MGEQKLAVDGSSAKPFPSLLLLRTGPYLSLILLLSLVVRLALILQKQVVGTDEAIYLALGKSLWQGHGLTYLGHAVTMCPPLLPLVAGAFSLFTEDLEVGTNFTYVVFGGFLVLPYFYLARRVYAERVARVAVFFLAVYPGLLLSFYWGSMTEPLYTLLLVAAFLILHRALQESRVLDFSLAGCLLGLVYLTRSEGILFFPVLFAYAVFRSAGDKRSFGKSIRNLVMLALCFLVVSAPYFLFVKKHSGGLSVSGKTKLILLAGAMDLGERESLLGRLTDEGTDLLDYEALVRDKTVLGMILENPKVLVGGSFVQIQRFGVTLFSWKVFPAFLLGFVILGLLRGPWDRDRSRQEGFLLVTCVPFLVFLTFQIWPRYLLPMTPVLLLWAVRGIVSLEAWIRESAERMGGERGPVRSWVVLLPRICVFLALAGMVVAKPVKARLLEQYPVEYKSAGRWMDENLPLDAEILARKPEIAFYARRMMRPLPNEELPRVLKYARSQGVEYLVVDDYFIGTRPQLEYLLRNREFPDSLALIYEERGPSGRAVRVFRMVNQSSREPSNGG